MDDQNTKGQNNVKGRITKHSRGGVGMRSRGSARGKRRDSGGIGPDGKPILPVVITVIFVLMMLVAVYFYTVEGWFKGEVDPASADVTIPPDVTPQPTYQASRPISTLDEKSLRVVALNVGQGSCTLMISPNGKTLLFGSGDAAHVDRVIEELAASGVEKLDAVFADSADEGHIGGMAKLAEAFSIGKLYAPEELLSSVGLGVAADKLEPVAAGASGGVAWDKSCSVSLYSSEITGCLVLRVEYNSVSFLLAGSLDIPGETSLLKKAGKDKLNSTVLFAASCGSADCTGNDFLLAVAPKHAVISVGTGGEAEGCPARDTLARLNAHSVKLHRTDRSGSIIMTVDKDGLHFI